MFLLFWFWLPIVTDLPLFLSFSIFKRLVIIDLLVLLGFLLISLLIGIDLWLLILSLVLCFSIKSAVCFWFFVTKSFLILLFHVIIANFLLLLLSPFVTVSDVLSSVATFGDFLRNPLFVFHFSLLILLFRVVIATFRYCSCYLWLLLSFVTIFYLYTFCDTSLINSPLLLLLNRSVLFVSISWFSYWFFFFVSLLIYFNNSPFFCLPLALCLIDYYNVSL